MEDPQEVTGYAFSPLNPSLRRFASCSDLLPSSSNTCFILIHGSFNAHNNLPSWYYYYFQFIPWETKCKEAHVLGDTKLEVAGQGFKLRKYDFQI